MEFIDGHFIDKELLQPGDFILDAGCRGFTLKEKLGADYKFICMDPDPDIEPVEGVIFLRAALMTFNGTTPYCGWSTGEGNFCYEKKAPWYADKDIMVDCMNLDTLMVTRGVKQFGLAKLDVEGAEYDLLLDVKMPFARQIAVEFHQACGYNRYGMHEEYMKKLEQSEFGQIYEVANWYEYTECPGIYEYLFKLRT